MTMREPVALILVLNCVFLQKVLESLLVRTPISPVRPPEFLTHIIVNFFRSEMTFQQDMVAHSKFAGYILQMSPVMADIHHRNLLIHSARPSASVAFSRGGCQSL